MVEGKGFIASPSRLSAYFAENSRRQTALEGPLEPFRVPIRPRFLGSRRRQNRAGLRQMPWTTHGEHEESAISPSTDPGLVSRSSARPLHPLHAPTTIPGQSYSSFPCPQLSWSRRVRNPNGIRTRVYGPPRAFVMVERSSELLTQCPHRRD